MLGDLHGQLPGAAGRADDQDGRAGLQVRSAAQRDPGGHRRVHRRGDRDRVGADRQGDRAAAVDGGLLRHRAERGVVGDEVDQLAVAGAADAVDAGDHRQDAVGAVVTAVGGRADPLVQAGRDDVDQDLVVAGDGRGELLPPRGGAERGDHCCVHG